MPIFDLLRRPPTFIPTLSTCCHDRVFFYVLDFVRKLQWSCSSLCRHLSGAHESRFGFRRSDRWPPIGSIPPSIQALSRRIFSTSRSVLFTYHSCFGDSNLLTSELHALHTLRSDPSIVIRPANKSGRWVEMDAAQYSAECERQLGDTSFYRELPSPVAPHLPDDIFTELLDLRRYGFTNKRELSFLLPPSSPRQHKFNLLPKIHKEAWSTALMPPGRPIIAEVLTESNNMARFIDFLALSSKLRQLHPRYWAPHRGLTNSLSPTMLSSLHHECEISLHERPDRKKGLAEYNEPSSVILIENALTRLLHLVGLCLENNDFVFDQYTWLQISGVAMGKAFGGAFASLYLAEWELAVLSYPATPSLFMTFQDDILILWDDEDEHLHFHRRLNSLDPHIQTDLTFHTSNVRFLDLEVFRQSDGCLGHRVAFKQTNGHNILPRDSHHARHVHIGILFSDPALGLPLFVKLGHRSRLPLCLHRLAVTRGLPNLHPLFFKPCP